MPDSSSPIVCSFESRRADDMCSLILRHGGQPLSAPSMREIPIEENPVAIQFVHAAIAGKFPVVILLTGSGTEALFEVARSQDLYDQLIEAFRQTSLIIRGPKPAAVLNRMGLKYAVRAPEPNTWRELVAAIDESGIAIHGQAVAVQEYGLPNARLYAELQTRGAIVTPVPVYRWCCRRTRLRWKPHSAKPLQATLISCSSPAPIRSVMCWRSPNSADAWPKSVRRWKVERRSPPSARPVPKPSTKTVSRSTSKHHPPKWGNSSAAQLKHGAGSSRHFPGAVAGALRARQSAHVGRKQCPFRTERKGSATLRCRTLRKRATCRTSLPP